MSESEEGGGCRANNGKRRKWGRRRKQVGGLGGRSC